jgi:transcriptional antiterminator NusG
LVGSSGNRTKPTPISEKEIKQIDKAIEKFAQDNSKGKKQEIQFQFKINDIIEIQTGPMKGLQGQVLEIKINSKKVVVNLELFNRMTPTEINMTDVKIIYSEKK